MQYHGVVQEGKRRGSELGYPTVNLKMQGGVAEGVYAAIVRIGKKEHYAAAFADPSRGIVEAHILDFFGDLYGQEIAIELVKKMRDTEVFHSDSALKIAVAEDVNSVRQYFSDIN